MAEVEEGEGFFCSLCKQDLRSFHLLDVHFREEHEESRGNKIKLNIKSIFDKAKSLSKPKSKFPHPVEDGASAVSKGGSAAGYEENADLLEPVTNVSGIASYWPPQEFGATTDYTADFKHLRDARLSNVVVETNRLVNRLEKLFRNLRASSPKTSRHMKTIEQSIVPWKKDDDEKNCTRCGRKFGPRRRKHHCRLCGGIVCKQCSQFMSHAEVYPVISDCPDYGKLAPRTTVRTRKLQIKSHSLGSAKSPTKKADDEEAIDELRMCTFCAKLIYRRLIHLEGLEKPMIVALYENMHLTMSEAERIKPSFVEVAESLLSGEHTYTLLEASKRRQELVRLYESIDTISKQILGVGSTDPSPREQKLTRSVRVYASNYLQDNLLSLPSLPTEHKLRQIRERVEREAQERVRELERVREQQRIEEEAAMAASASAEEERTGLDKFLDFSKELSTKVADSLKRESEPVGVPLVRKGSNSGWMCSSEIVKSVDSSEDPFLLQKQQLLSYIKQARAANRMDEVHTLELSLREIEASMIEQKKLSFGFSPDK